MDIKANIKKQMQSIFKAIDISVQDIPLEVPSDLVHGDYTTNIAFILAKQLKKSPLVFAQELATKLQANNAPEFEKIEAVKPGFINFYLSRTYLLEVLQHFLQNKKENLSKPLQGKKIMVEFTDPNPFKEFHIGHLYSNIVGESLCRLLESQGADVKRVCYQGDVGLHVAKSLWGVMHMKPKRQSLEDLENESLEERIKFLGKSYALGSAVYEEDAKAKEEIIDINKKLYTKEDPLVNEFYDIGKKWSLEYFEKIYQRLGTKFWHYYFESEAGPIGAKLVREHIVDHIFEEDQGAVIFRGEKYGVHTRVFINSQGLPTYEAKELGLVQTKYKDFPYDQSVIITANEVDDYFKVLLKALALITPDLAKKTKHLSHGVVKLPSGKMSSRTGKIVTGEFLLSEAVKKANDLAMEKGIEAEAQDRKKIKQIHNFSLQSKRLQINEAIGIGAIKYSLLKSSIGRDIEYNFNESITLEGNSGPYIQYAYARVQSILSKAKTVNIQLSMINSHNFKNHIFEKEEVELMRFISQYNQVIQYAALTYSPNFVTNYLFTLAKSFSFFYQKYRILNAKSDQEKQLRLSLVIAVGNVLKSGLWVLGIAAVEKM